MDLLRVNQPDHFPVATVTDANVRTAGHHTRRDLDVGVSRWTLLMIGVRVCSMRSTPRPSASLIM